MAFMNYSGEIYGALSAITSEATGSWFITLFIIFFALLIIALVFRLPIEVAVIFLLPLVFVMAAYTAGWYAILGLAIIILGYVLARAFMGR